MSTPALSVIVPSYNAALWLRDAVASVLAQDFKDWELVIVDDASTDAQSRDLARSFDGERVRVHLREVNGGVAAARNTAIKLARAPVIVPLDPDDELPQGALGAIAQAFSQGADFAFGPMEQVNWLTGESRIVDPKPDARASQDIGQPWHGCSPFTKALWEKLGGYDEWRGFVGLDDWHFWLRAEAAGARGRYCAQTLYRYRMRPGSISNECRPEWLEASLRTFRDLPRGFLPAALKRKIIVARSRQASTYFRKRGKPFTAARYAWRGLWRVPWSRACMKTLCGCLAECVLPPLRRRYTALFERDERERAELESRLRSRVSV